MPRKGSPYGYDYEQDRKRLLASNPRCVWCGRGANSADHYPPIEHHEGGRASHRHGSGCCRLVPACMDCQRRQGGMIAARKAAIAALPPDVDLEAMTQEVPEPLGFDVFDPVWDVPWLEDLRDVPEGAVWPRLMSAPHPRAVGSYGAEIEGWARWQGLADPDGFHDSDDRGEFRWFQRLALRRIAEHDEHGAFVWLVALLTLARQLGKSTLLRALLMWRIHHAWRFKQRQLVLHTGNDLGAVREVMRPMMERGREREDVYDVREVNSQEAIEVVADGSRWIAKSNRRAGYAFSGTVAAVDEAWDVPASVVDDGVEPTLVTRREPLLLIVSTAHSTATSLVPRRRALALSQLAAPTRTLLMEWSAPRSMPIDDEAGWRMASPHWDDQREAMIRERVTDAKAGIVDPSSKERDPVESVRTQWLNQWPSLLVRGGRGEPFLAADVWESLKAGEARVEGPLVIAVEDWTGQGAGVCAAGVSEDGPVLVRGRAFERRSSAYEWAGELAAGAPGSVLLVGRVLVGDSELDDLPVVEVSPMSGTDTRAGLALVREMIAEHRLVHDGSPDLAEQVAAARVSSPEGGGLSLVSVERRDLVRCLAWAAARAHRETAALPQFY